MAIIWRPLRRGSTQVRLRWWWPSKVAQLLHLRGRAINTQDAALGVRTGLTYLEHNENRNSRALEVLVGMLWPLEPVTNPAALAAAFPHSTSGRLGEAHDQQ